MTAAPAPIYFHDAAGKMAFHCAKLRCDLSVDACKANFLSGRLMSCSKPNCPTGLLHSGAKEKTARDIAFDSDDAHARYDAKAGLACVRCGRTGSTVPATQVCRHRLVNLLHCVSCANRNYEHRGGGFNSKGGLTVKHRHLKTVTVTVLDADGTVKTLKPFVSGGEDETRRALGRLHPGWKVGEVRYADGTTADLEPEKD